jgi:hypothetical protein
MNQISLTCNPTRSIIVDKQHCAVVSMSNLRTGNFSDIVIGVYNFSNTRQKSGLIDDMDDQMMYTVVQQYEKLRESEMVPMFCNFNNSESTILKAIRELLSKQTKWLGRQFIDTLDIQTIARYLIPTDIKIELKFSEDTMSIFEHIETVLTSISASYSMVYTVYRVIQECIRTKQKVTNTDLSRVLRETGHSVPSPDVLSLLCVDVAKLIKRFQDNLVSLSVLEEKLLQKVNPIQYFLYTEPSVSQEKMSITVECIDKMIAELGLNATGTVVDTLCRLFLNMSTSEEILKNVKIFY